jgi:FkbM family methyltransferase
MLKQLLLRLMRPVRQLLGIELILQNQRQIIEALSIERRSQLYFDCLDVIHLLSPMDVADARYVRLGRHHDGGYVVLEELLKAARVAYSFGVADDTSFEEALSEYDVDVVMFDHTIEKPDVSNSRLRFLGKGITGFEPARNCSTLAALLQENGHENETEMILKLDVEGCEWDVLAECSSSVLSRFSQIVVEYHSITPWIGVPWRDSLKKLNQTHQCVHVHGARSCHPGTTPLVIGDLILPRQLEATYVRRDDFCGRFLQNTRQFPTPVDMSSFSDLADIDLGFFAPCPPKNRSRIGGP